MATNIRLFRFFLAGFLFLGLSSVFAQNSGYYINTENGEPRFIQRLAWSGEFSLRYEVIIENGAGGTYRNYHREYTTELYIDISLQPGSYRFRVIPYDILNRPGAASEWKYIEVLPALQPEPTAVLPEYITSGGVEPSGYLLVITGNSLNPDAEIFIRRADGTRFAARTLGSGDDGSIIAFVESETLIPGEYGIVVRNPGGLEAGISGVLLLLPETVYLREIEIFTDEEELADSSEQDPYSLKPVIFSAVLAYMPSFPIYGDYMKGAISILGLNARANLLFYIPIGVYIGPELTALGFLTNYPDEDGKYFRDDSYLENIKDRFTLAVGVNLLVRKWFPGRRAALSFRAGVDYCKALPDYDQVSVKMDVSFLWRFANNVLIEGGLDYSHMLSEISGGLFRPWLGVGFQL
jgi:hypothetical protein